jgi:hypothetical protein
MRTPMTVVIGKPKRLSSHHGEDEPSGHAADDSAEQEIPPDSRPEFPESHAPMPIIEKPAALWTSCDQDNNVMRYERRGREKSPKPGASPDLPVVDRYSIRIEARCRRRCWCADTAD